MTSRRNPFLVRASETATSDQEFARLFCPDILDKLPMPVFESGVHLFRSPPGGGKTTLLRAFTPTAQRALWNSRTMPAIEETVNLLSSRGSMSREQGPQLLGVYLSCASGYADLPAGVSQSTDDVFRALLNCRIVLRALKSLASFIEVNSPEELSNAEIAYDPNAELEWIPMKGTITELLRWAQQIEREIYSQLESGTVRGIGGVVPRHARFEGVLWLQWVEFRINGELIAPSRILMVDDIHKLKSRHRDVLLVETTEMRPSMPVWLASRSIAFQNELIAQGSRQERDLSVWDLGQIWGTSRTGAQFFTFAQSVLDRRLSSQGALFGSSFAQYLRSEIETREVKAEISEGVEWFVETSSPFSSNPAYSTWLAGSAERMARPTTEALKELVVTTILMARNEKKRQLSFDLGPLSNEELESRDSSALQGAAEIFMHDKFKFPYYFGIERLCTLASENVEELLALASTLFEELVAKETLRKALVLSPSEQENLLRKHAKNRIEFIPKSHSEGVRAKLLLESIGTFCRERTFQLNAPIAPGVTGLRLSKTEIDRLNQASTSSDISTLKRVLQECVAENLLLTRQSQNSTNREQGTVFYLNRTICAHFGLPLQSGGWQETTCDTLATWMERGIRSGKVFDLRIV